MPKVKYYWSRDNGQRRTSMMATLDDKRGEGFLRVWRSKKNRHVQCDDLGR